MSEWCKQELCCCALYPFLCLLLLLPLRPACLPVWLPLSTISVGLGNQRVLLDVKSNSTHFAQHEQSMQEFFEIPIDNYVQQRFHIVPGHDAAFPLLIQHFLHDPLPPSTSYRDDSTKRIRRKKKT
ncbi:hypothetical protein IWZ01DRAFT_530543 [Phyllosticta capitalensis]